MLCVGGGIGYTPFLAVAREALGQRRYGAPPRVTERAADRITLCYGVRSASHRADLSDFPKSQRLSVRIATDDGSEGHHGLVTDLVAQSLGEAERPGPSSAAVPSQ